LILHKYEDGNGLIHHPIGDVMTTTGKFLTCETQKGIMDIYVASPITKEKVPVVIVLQEAFGVNAHIRSVCDRLAEEGFLAAAPELFHREGKRIEIPYENRKDIMPLLGKLTNQEIVQDIRATINFLEDLPTADTKSVSTIGFCVGGFASVLSATKLSIKKMISFYGGGMVHSREGFSLTPVVNDLGLIKSKCLFFFGGKDASISRDDISEVEKKLTTAKVSFEVDIFENSDHGFFCDVRKSYDPDASAVAWKKSITFLKE
jgi:carboxymethylenebutenolidase